MYSCLMKSSGKKCRDFGTAIFFKQTSQNNHTFILISPQKIINILIGIIAKGGCLLLGVGLTPSKTK